MTILGSLTNRIFFASAALAVLSIGFAVYLVSRTTTREAEAELQRGLTEAGTLVDQQTASLVQTFTVMAQLVADLPKLKAAVAESDPPTIRPIAEDYQRQLGAALLVVTDRRGQVLAAAGNADEGTQPIGLRPEIQQALAGHETAGFWPESASVLQLHCWHAELVFCFGELVQRIHGWPAGLGGRLFVVERDIVWHAPRSGFARARGQRRAPRLWTQSVGVGGCLVVRVVVVRVRTFHRCLLRLVPGT